MKTIRYHLQLSDHRTTVSLEKTVSDLMAIKLGEKPGTIEAHQAVRKQIDSFIAKDRGRGGLRLGRYIAEQSILYLVDKILSDRYIEYCTSEDSAE